MPQIDCRGVDLYYEFHGPAAAPVLVLNNGILMTTASWAPQIAALSRSYRLLLYDCRGQGRSDHPATPYSMAVHAGDLDALLDRLGIDSAHVLGISYGGEVAQAFALAFPGRVRSLILADTVSEVGAELRLIVEGWRAAAQAGDGDLLYLVSAPWNFSPAFIEANAGVLAAARSRYRDLDLAAVVRLCDAFLQVDFTARLNAIHARTCIIVGDQDLLKGPRYAEILHRHICGSELHVLRGAAHASCWEAPEEFNRTVLEFLARG